jgi:hypothetical protein
MRLSIAHKSSVFSAGGDGISRHEPLTVANEIVRLEIAEARPARDTDGFNGDAGDGTED